MKYDLKKPSPNLSQIKCFSEKIKANNNSMLIRRQFHTAANHNSNNILGCNIYTVFKHKHPFPTPKLENDL